MSAQEFYIREAHEDEARGPFNLEQLVSLAETGQLSFETLWYDASVEGWAAIGANDELRQALFPEKRRLRMKAREPMAAPKSADSLPPITVEDMLAGAEGRTKETRDKVDPTIAMANAARIGMWAAVAALVASAAGEALPAADAIGSLDLGKILDQPLVFLGAADLFIGTMLALGVVTFYPIVRFRAAAGLGLFGFVFFAQGQVTPLLTVAAGSAGLYFCTVFVEMLPVMIAAGLGVIGLAGTAYFLLSI
jgi:hypothetical protein